MAQQLNAKALEKVCGGMDGGEKINVTFNANNLGTLSVSSCSVSKGIDIRASNLGLTSNVITIYLGNEKTVTFTKTESRLVEAQIVISDESGNCLSFLTSDSSSYTAMGNVVVGIYHADR